MIPEPGKRKKPKSVTEGINVRRKPCKHCLFGKDPLLESKQQIKDKIDGCLRDNRTFACHEFDNVTCKGFFDRHKRDVLPTRVGLALDAIVWVN